MAASDVVVLGLRMADLTQRSARARGAARQLLQRSLRPHHVRPQKKLLLVTVTDFDGGLASEADVAAFVSAEVDALWGGLLKPSTCEAAAAGDALEVQCAFLPHPSLAEEAFSAALSSLAARFTDAASPAYLFADGRARRRRRRRRPPSSASAPRAPRPPKPAPPASRRRWRRRAAARRRRRRRRASSRGRGGPQEGGRGRAPARF